MKNNSISKNDLTFQRSFGKSPNLDFCKHICSPLFQNKNLFSQNSSSKFIDHDFLNSQRQSNKIAKINIEEEDFSEKLRNILTPQCKRADLNSNNKELNLDKTITNQLIFNKDNYNDFSNFQILNKKSAFEKFDLLNQQSSNINNLSNLKNSFEKEFNLKNNVNYSQINSTIFPSLNNNNTLTTNNNTNSFNNSFDAPNININITTNHNYNIINNTKEGNYNEIKGLLKKKRGRKPKNEKLNFNDNDNILKEDNLDYNYSLNYQYNLNKEEDTAKVVCGEYTGKILKNTIKTNKETNDEKLKLRRFKKTKNLTLHFDERNIDEEDSSLNNKNECNIF